MEMDAGGPNSKRRKLAEAESNEEAAAPPATEAPDPDPTETEQTTRDQEPPPGVDEEEGGVDRISELPDPILGEIISLLPTKKGARTQVLASRWRHLWRSAPLNLDCRRLPDDRRMRDDVVSRILSTHPGPCRRFRLPAYYLEDRAAAVDTWLLSPVLDNLQELDFCNVWHYEPTRQPPPLAPPPASAFRFSATLRGFTIGRCCLPDSTVQALHFPQLKQLALERVCISECSLSRLIAGCPALECLLIFYSFGFSCAWINSVSLRSIGVRLRQHRCFHHQTNELQFRKLIIENAPCLERLLRLDLFDGLHVSVISAPKLRTLGYLFNRMDYSSTLTQQLPHDSLTTVVGSVKVLAVNIFLLDLDKTFELMKCLPFLEKLYISRSVSGDKNLWIRKHRNLIKCLDIRLKTVVLESYRGIRAQVSFAKFFVMIAKMLETMIFQVQAEDYYRGFVGALQKVPSSILQLIDISAVIQ